MKMKIINMILISAICASAYAGIVSGNGEINNKAYVAELTENNVFDGGTGAENDPFIISNSSQLAAVADLPDKCYELKNDITLPSEWVPIGNVGDDFSGTFNGAGHTVSVSTFDNDSYVGIFRINNGTIKNLNVESDFAESSYTNTYRLYTGAICGENCGTIADSSAVGKYKYTILYASSRYGAYNIYSGAVAGVNSGVISGCSSKCDIETDISDYYNSYLGGIAGYNKGTIENSYYIGNITAEESDYVGGLVGYNRGTLNKTYASAVISAGATGGLTGYDLGNTEVSDSYYDSDVSGSTDTGKGEPKTTSEMKMQDMYENWDFSNIWGMDENINDGYPYLLSEKIDDGTDDGKDNGTDNGTDDGKDNGANDGKDNGTDDGADEINVGITMTVTAVEFEKNESGANGTVSVTVNSIGMGELSSDIAVGIYDESGRLIGIKKFTEKLQSGINDIVLDDIQVNSGTLQSSYNAKIFVWDSVTGMKPLTESIPFTI